MYKILRPLKDAYITNRVINGTRRTSTNVGAGGSLDLFKLYGITYTTSGSTRTANTELSRLLIKFDIEPLRTLVSKGKLDFSNPSFHCSLKLSDVYGGQPTPSNFSVVVAPLSASFDEGLGGDVVFYSDNDVCNWLTSSYASGSWYVTGCGLAGDGTAPSDYLTASAATSLITAQAFVTGEEDLYIDVTTAISATLAGLIPDQGFRIAFSQQLETDQHTYFVKRFASRTAYNEDLRPKLIATFDESIQDDSTNSYLDSTSCIFMYNYIKNVPANLNSGSSAVSGQNCLILRLTTPVSGGHYSLYFTGSQHYSGINPQPGIYSASITVSSVDPVLLPQWHTSGSIIFTPIWQSLDGTISYHTGSTIEVKAPQRGAQAFIPRYTVSVPGLPSTLTANEQTNVRVNIFDATIPQVMLASRLPVELTGKVIRDVHFQIRDAVTGLVVIPFDLNKNSTRMSSDSMGMFFKLDTSDLTGGRSYIIDVMIVTDSNQQYYAAASPTFKVDVTS